MSAVRRTGAALGGFAHAVDGFHRRIALANIARALPSKSLEERRETIRRVFAHFGSVLLELIKIGTLTNDDILAHLETEGEERVRQAYAKGRGVLLFTGHFGYWEVGAMALALRVQPVSVMARPLDNPYLHQMLERIRTRLGNSVIYRQGAIRKVLQELAANRGVAILIDQHLHTPDAVYVDFFSALPRQPMRLPHSRCGRALRDSRVHHASPARTLSRGVRARRGAARLGFTGCGLAIHATLHRRAGDVHSPPSRPVALDAPSVAHE
jgi:lauroyl/myristoyl acyltransferase